MPYCYFDIETTGLDFENDKLTCAVFQVDDEDPKVFYTVTDCAEFIASCAEDYTFVTFNGLGFDFYFILQQYLKNIESKSDETSKKVASIAQQKHVDIMYAFLSSFGYYSSMQSFAVCYGHSKTWSGSEAAESSNLPAIVEYCKQDVKVMKAVFQAISKNRVAKRKTMAGRLTVWTLPTYGIPFTYQAFSNAKTFPPDQSWMKTPPNLLLPFEQYLEHL